MIGNDFLLDIKINMLPGNELYILFIPHLRYWYVLYTIHNFTSKLAHFCNILFDLTMLIIVSFQSFFSQLFLRNAFFSTRSFVSAICKKFFVCLNRKTIPNFFFKLCGTRFAKMKTFEKFIFKSIYNRK